MSDHDRNQIDERNQQGFLEAEPLPDVEDIRRRAVRYLANEKDKAASPSDGHSSASTRSASAAPTSGASFATLTQAALAVDPLYAPSPMVDAVIDQVDGRMIRVGDHWLADFASCNYLGFDLDPEIIAGIPDYLARWGTHPSWSRGIASTAPYQQLEAEAKSLLGVEDVLAFPTLTHTHNGLLPALAGEGTLLVDLRAHRTINDAAVLARAKGASVRRFRHNDVEHAERLLRAAAARAPRVVCVDGINSMTGNATDLPAFAALAREHDALLYVDDAHGFGVLGERTGYDPSPYGRRGNGTLRWFGESYDQVVLTAGFSKAYSSLLAFVAVPTQLKQFLKAMVPSYIYSGPVPVASLATTLLGLQVNERRGDELRAQLWHRTRTLLDHLDKLGIATSNTSGFPLVQLALADPEDLAGVGRHLFERGVYVTMAPFPVVPRDEVGFRVQLTAANTTEQVDQLLTVLQEVDDRFGFRRPHP
jgi:8-amino-7-oxononanoate synthase